jgi:Septum formation
MRDEGGVTKFEPRRLAVSIALFVVIAIVASGCSGIQNLAQGLIDHSARPAVGECWRATFEQTQKTEDWEGSPAISCGKAHQSYTFAMTKLAKKFTYRSWLTSGGNIRSDVDQSAYEACRARQRAELPGVTTKEALLAPTYYLPSTALWAAGQRWVRCDITLIKVGSTVAEPKLADLPAFAELVSTLKTNPVKYALCEDDPASNGPDGAQTTYADCTGPADLTFLAELAMAGADGAPYPGLAALTKIGATQCAALKVPAGHVVVAEPPLKSDWTKYDDRSLDCWVNNN